MKLGRISTDCIAISINFFFSIPVTAFWEQNYENFIPFHFCVNALDPLDESSVILARVYLIDLAFSYSESR